MVAPVVDMAWVDMARLDVARLGGQGSGLAIADVRWYLDGRSGREAFERGHLPGAVFVDLDEWLSGDPRAGRGRHPLPDPGKFAAGMSALGIGDGTVVVAYDDQGGVIAARLVWMLRATGHEAALLDGGLDSYSGPMTTGEQAAAPARFTARPWPSRLLAGIDDASDPSNVVLDARGRDRYHGENEQVDPQAGHIPGALSVPCRENLGTDGRFLPVEDLRQRFTDAGVTAGTPVVSYCGSGVTACHNLLALELCGLGQGRLYPGSWSEYSATPGRPVAT
ncbi:MAG: sulfurtransferase [Acidimicrobiales bacterium]|jgi:thiosulfate/3-mercaptopyruvate sulfurtransferase